MVKDASEPYLRRESCGLILRIYLLLFYLTISCVEIFYYRIMSDYKRSSLVTAGSNKPDNNNDVNKKVIRLNLVLSEPNKEWCPVFNYEVLIKQAQDTREAGVDSSWNRNLNGTLIHFSEDDDKESMKRLAKQLEEKYGGNDKRKRCQTYTELGAGYDENDSFIDNTEACEEGLLDELEKKHDGYYINCERFGRLCNSDASDHEEVRLKSKKAIKRNAESEDDGSVEEKTKKSKFVSEVQDTSEGIDHPLQSQNIPIKDTQKKPESKKLKTVKNISEEKGTSDVTDLKNSGYILPVEPKKNTEDHKSVNDVIESVINAVHSENDSTCDTYLSSASGPQSGSLVSSDSEVSNAGGKSMTQHETPPVLPEGLSQEIKSVVNDLILAAADHKENDKKLFSPAVNSLILRLEYTCRSELTASVKNTVYTHLAYFLPFSKATLVTRGKKLVLGELDSEIESVIVKFKSIIDSKMPHLQEAYSHIKIPCIKVPQIKMTENECSNTPTKTFLWDDNLRNCLGNIVRLKVKQFKITHGRKQTLDVYINDFLSEKLLPIWPKGWMTTSLIYKQCSDVVYEEAKLSFNSITFSNISKKTCVPPDVNYTKMKIADKNSPDSGHSSDFLSCSNVVEVSKKDCYSTLYSPKWKNKKVNDLVCINKLDRTKVPLKKKTLCTGIAQDDSMFDKNDKDNQKNFKHKNQNEHGSVAICIKTENLTSNDETPFVMQKIPKSKAGPMSLKHRILHISAKDVDKIKSHHQKSGDQSFNWKNGLDNKCDEHSNGKPNSISIHNDDFSVVDSRSISPSEMERRMHEETTAATDILSQLITDQNSLSQNITGCGTDDKVQMQLNEVMQDLVVLNQMSADTVDTLETTNKEELQKMPGITTFEEQFYSHNRKETIKLQISDECEQVLYDNIPNKDSRTSDFTSQRSVITQNTTHQPVLQSSHLSLTGVSSSQHN